MPPTSEFEREMRSLEAELKRLEAEYTMFFAGRLPRLPWETRTRVEALVKRYDRGHIQNTADRFRFQTLQARFASFCELWERNLRAQEEGRPVGGRRAPRAPAAPPPSPAPPAPAPGRAAAGTRRRDEVVHVTSLRDPAAEGGRVRELFEQLESARSAAGEPPIAYDRFQALVEAQVKKLGAGGREVAFRVAMKEGKVTLTAKTLAGG
ncbi:MAG: MXAN_5187 C-terminal domain-containing protein [Vicinamibacterales bacterium]